MTFDGIINIFPDNLVDFVAPSLLCQAIMFEISVVFPLICWDL